MKAILKQFLIIFVPLALLIFSISTAIYVLDVRAEKKKIKTNNIHRIQLKKEVIADDLHSIVSDLLFLAEQEELKDSIGKNQPGKYILPNYLLFIDKKGIYDYIAILNAEGNEVLRVNYNNGQPDVVFEQLLQSKRYHDDFRETFVLNRGEYYMSPFDLNIEEGEIEQPLKPSIRFGTPIFDKQGQRRGIILLSYLGRKMIHDLKKGDTGAAGDLMLLNSEGYWLISSNPEDEWGFMLNDGKNKRFEKKYSVAWEIISREETGHYFDNNHGLFIFTTVYPLLESLKSGSSPILADSADATQAKTSSWKIVSHVLPEVLNAKSKEFLLHSFELNIVLYLILAVGSGFLAKAGVHRRQALEEQKRLSTAIMHAVEGVIITNLKGEIQYVNPAFENITGYTKQDVMGKNPSIIKSGLHDQNFYKEMWECILSGKTWKSEYINKKKNGTLYNSYASIAPIKNREGEIINFVGVSIDISENKRSQEAIANKVEELARSHKMLEQFSSAVSSKINNFMQLLQKQYKDKLDTDPADFFQFTIHGVSSIQELIGDLLTFSRLNSFSNSLKPTNTEKVFKSVLSNLKKSIKKSKVVITCDSLPTVIADEHRLSELFENLIENAIKYCGKKAPRVQISAKERDRPVTSFSKPSTGKLQSQKEWVFSIADNGIGIDKQYYEQVFNLFKRLHTLKECPGTGVGLAICKEIVEQFGGNIWVESQLGKGTVFYFTLPVTNSN